MYFEAVILSVFGKPTQGQPLLGPAKKNDGFPKQGLYSA